MYYGSNQRKWYIVAEFIYSLRQKKKKKNFYIYLLRWENHYLAFPRPDDEGLANVSIKKSLGWKYMVNQKGLAASLKVGYFVHIS